MANTNAPHEAIDTRLPASATHSIALESIAEDKAAVDAALRALWPRLRLDQHGPMCLGLVGLLDARAALQQMQIAIQGELSA